MIDFFFYVNEGGFYFKNSEKVFNFVYRLLLIFMVKFLENWEWLNQQLGELKFVEYGCVSVGI